MAARRIVGFIIAVLLVLSGGPSSVLEPSGHLLTAAPACSPRPQPLSPEEALVVLADFHAARAASNWAAVRCILDDDAVMILRDWCRRARLSRTGSSVADVAPRARSGARVGSVNGLLPKHARVVQGRELAAPSYW